MNYILQNFMDAVTELISSVVESLSNIIELIFNMGMDIALGSKISGVNAAALFTQGLASVLLCCMAGKQIFTTYISETDGDSDMEPTQILVKYSMAMAVIWSTGAIFQIAVKWGKLFTDEVVGSADVEFKNALEAALASVSTVAVGVTNVTPTLLLTFYLISIFIFAFKAGTRGAELTVFRILMPIIACDIITPSRERWNAFITSFLTTVFGYSIQILLFRISIQVLIAGNTSPILNYTMAFAFIWLAIVMPDWLKKFSYSSGLGHAAGSTGHSAAFIAASFLRRV